MPQGIHIFVRRIDVRSGLSAALALRGDMDAPTTLRLIAARRRTGETGLILASIPATAFDDPAAFDAALKDAGHDPRSIAWGIADRMLDADRLAALAKLRARGWALELVTTRGPAPALAARDRTLFASLAVIGAWRDAISCDALRQRRRAAAAMGLQCVWAGTGEPSDQNALYAEGFDARETSTLYPAEARASSDGPALSFSNR